MGDAPFDENEPVSIIGYVTYYAKVLALREMLLWQQRKKQRKKRRKRRKKSRPKQAIILGIGENKIGVFSANIR